MSLRFKLISVFLLVVFSLRGSSGDSTILQLKWWHQFQFAGYYAAQIKGYYKQEGLNVTILQGDPRHAPVQQVLNGKADFGVSGSDLIINYINGDPVISIGAIFQHSPYIILSDSASNIHSPADLIGKTIMASKEQGWVQLEAMLLKEGIPRDSVKIIDHSWNLDDLSNGKANAQSAYSSVEPYQLKAKGIPYCILKPVNYGIDFYGDILFTTKQNVEDKPADVEKFRKASFLGWQYAMQHPEELADYILTLPGVKERGLTKEMLMAEYGEMNKLILSNVIEVGHQNPGRWEHILDTYKSLKLVSPSASVKGFVFDPVVSEQERISMLVLTICILIGITLLLSLVNYYFQRRKRIATQQRLKKSEEHLELAVNSAGVGIWDWDIKNDQVFFNTTWKTMLGYSASELEDHSNVFFNLLHPDDKTSFEKKLKKHIAGTTDQLSEIFRMKTKSGVWKWILSQCKAQIRNSEGVATHLAGIHLDMDELKKKERELHGITDELMRMNTELQQFAFVTSHNLRAPAANMVSLLRIIDYTQLSDANKNIHRKLEFSANVLINTLQDLNDILTAKKATEKEKERINIPQRIESIIAIYNDGIKSSGAKITTDFEVSELYFPINIFDSIISNLLSNALKFREHVRSPRITFSSRENEEYIFITIQDNGKGIDLKLQGEKMFKLYQRFHERTEGKGMGLYIIRVQLENLGGKITVESAPGEGASFTIWIKKDL